MGADVRTGDVSAEVQVWLRSVEGSDLHLGWLAGVGRWEACLADHPRQLVWTGEGEEPDAAIAQALDRWHVGHPGSTIIDCSDCGRPIYSRGELAEDGESPVCATCALTRMEPVAWLVRPASDDDRGVAWTEDAAEAAVTIGCDVTPLYGVPGRRASEKGQEEEPDA